MRTSSTVVTVNFADFTCIHGFSLAMFVMTVMAWVSNSGGGGFFFSFSSSDRQEDVVRVAMVGNSMMYYNDLPRLLEAMSGGRLQQDSCLHGDASLESHLVYGNGMLDIWTNGQARMWDVDEKEAAKEDYYDVYSPYYYYSSNNDGGDDDSSSSSSSSSSSYSSSSSSSQTVDSSYIYDYGACTVEQLLLGYDKRFDEVYEEEAKQYYYYNNNDDDDDSNNANNDRDDNRRRRRDERKNRTRRRMKKRISKRRRILEQQQQQQEEEEVISFSSLGMNNNNTSFSYSTISSSSSSSFSTASSSSSSWSQRSRDRQQEDLLQQLSGTMRRQKNHDDQQRANQQQQQQQQQRQQQQQLYDSKRLRDHRRISNWRNWRRRRAEEEDAAGANDAEGDDDMVAVDDDQAAADADEDENASDDGYDDNDNVNDDGNAADAAADDDDANSNANNNNNNNADNDNYDEDDAYYAYTDDDSTDGAISYDDDYYQDTYDEKYPLEDDGMNPCLASANYYFFKQRQYDDFGPPQWDYVLINDNTRSPCCTDQRATSLELLDDVYVPWLRETKAVPIFMVTHSYWSSIRDMSGVTDVPTFLSLTYEGYREFAETVGKALPANQQPKIAPVGLAFLLVWEENRSMWYNLIHQDEIHLTPTGTFLEGLIVFSTIYGHLPSPAIVLSGEVANLFSNARRMTPSEHIQEAYPTLDQARYLYHIAGRILKGELPKSFIRYENGESADWIPEY